MSKKFHICLEENTETLLEESFTEDELESNQAKLALEIDEDSHEIDRQSELVEGLEALRTIASKLDTPSPTQMALFRVAANMAVIGTDQRAQDFLPAMESNKPIALEGFGDKIKDMIKAIIAKLREWWDKFKNWIKGLFNKEKIVIIKATKLSETIKEKVKEKVEPITEKVIFTNDKDSVKLKGPTLSIRTKVVENPIYTKPETSKVLEKESVVMYVDKILMSYNDFANKKVSIRSIKYTVGQIEGLASSSLWTIIPNFVNHVQKYFNIIKVTKQKDSFIKEIEKEGRMRLHLIESTIKNANVKDYFSSEVEKDSNEKNILLGDNTLSSCFFIEAHLEDNTNPFIFKDILYNQEGKNTFVHCEDKIPNIEELQNLCVSISSHISRKPEYVVLDKSTKEIENLNTEILNFLEKFYNEDWVKDLNEQERNEIINICFVKLKELILLLNNVQKFSSKCLHAYYTSCEKEISFYNNLITLNYL